MRVLILGGYGVFGGRLAQLLLEDGHDVFVAGRSLLKARAFCKTHGGAALALDSNASGFAAELAQAAPEIVVDAAGPFQDYGADPYRVARAALACGAHYLDLCDDADFTAGISVLDAEAKGAGRVVLSGVSSVPAISSAAAAACAEGLEEIGLIESAICPGNRAPRGHSVMAAILAQTGQPLALWRGGRWTSALGWSGHRRVALSRAIRRPAALIGAPDLKLFPEFFNARSVIFRAGLELGVMHWGLAVLGWMRRQHMLPDLVSMSRLLQRAAALLEPFGTDRGGMLVRVEGRLAEGRAERREWRLVAEKGDGPFIPAIPGALLTHKLSAGEVPTGARSALCEFTLAEAEQALSRLALKTEIQSAPAPRLFEQALGPRWAKLPEQLRAGHDLWDQQQMSGRASIERGGNPLARIIAGIFRFPVASEDVPVTVTMTRAGETERWERNFGGQKFHSVLSKSAPGCLNERFGPFTFQMELTGTDAQICMPVRAGWFLGVPLPRFCLPRSETIEQVQDGRFTFDVDLSFPLAGRLVRYRGWLVPDVDGLS